MRSEIAAEEAPVSTLIDELLLEQQRLTAVERFARKHERGQLPAQARYYRELIPLTKPGPGEQYAFAVSLDACTGCKACVSACHSLNGLDEDETWRSVGMIHGGTTAAPYQQTITSACHHCADPGCLNGCPVGAYEKEADTGIVRHLDDQCIGCQYCILKCPYDVPKYSAKRGIVRKCDMCYSRLAADEAPACVQACPTGAISIRIVSRDSIAATAEEHTRMLPGAFPSEYTLPSTEYRSQRPVPANAWSADAHRLRLEHAHWPLIAMLLLTQMAAGLHVVLATTMSSSSAATSALSIAAFATLNLGLAVSVLHLGRPLGAWRAFLGLGTSWMSREILGFSIFAGASAASAFTSSWSLISSLMPAAWLPMPFDPTSFAPTAAWATAFTGLLGVYCSAMIYIDTRRTLWKAAVTHPRFFGTTLLLGTTGAASLLSWISAVQDPSLWKLAGICAGVGLLVRSLVFGRECVGFLRAFSDTDHPNHRSARTAWEFRRPLVYAAPVLFIAATALAMAALIRTDITAALLATLSFALTLIAQTIERYFYFVTVVAPKMPGGVAA